VHGYDGSDDGAEPDAPQHGLVVIRTFPHEIAARIAQLGLDAHGIPSALLGDDAGGVYPALTFSHGVRLGVRHIDAVRALRVLDSQDDDGEPPPEPVI